MQFGKLSICSQADTAAVIADIPDKGWSSFAHYRVGPKAQEATMRFRFMAADPEAGTLDLVRSAVTLTRGHCQPEELDEEILQHCGPFYEPPAVDMVADEDHLEAWLDEM